jgi:hypothetical protein
LRHGFRQLPGGNLAAVFPGEVDWSKHIPLHQDATPDNHHHKERGKGGNNG